jgi:hypothetical protein
MSTIEAMTKPQGRVAEGLENLLTLLHWAAGESAAYAERLCTHWHPQQLIHLTRILQRVAELVGGEQNRAWPPEESNSRGVVPTVLNEWLCQSAWCDGTDLRSTYLAGILASARAPVGQRDDQALPFLSVVRSLSLLQITAHFALYTAVVRAHEKPVSVMMTNQGRRSMQTLMPIAPLIDCLPEGSRRDDQANLLAHILFGLRKEHLLDTDFRAGSPQFLEHYDIRANRESIAFTPSATGVELFVWARGHGRRPLKDLTPGAIEADAMSRIHQLNLSGFHPVEYQPQGRKADPLI